MPYLYNKFKKNKTRVEAHYDPLNEIPTQAGAYGHWRLDEALVTDTAVDQTGNYNLSVLGAPAVVATPLTRARSWVNTTADGLRTAIISAPLTQAEGEWWFMCWLLNSDQAAGSGAIITYQGAGETAANNDVLDIGITGTSFNGVPRTRNKIYCNWEYSTGLDVQTFSVNTVPNGVWTFIAVSKYSVGGGLYGVSFFINGRLDSAYTGLTNSSGNSGATSRLGLGKAGGAGSHQFTGVFDEPQWVGGTVTEATILSIYNASVGLP
jgi:hypothetical protein